MNIQLMDADQCWDIVIKARDGSRSQTLALERFITFCETVLQSLNIYRNFPTVRAQAQKKILSFASDFDKSLETIREVDYIPELKMLVLKKALKFSSTMEEYEKLLPYFDERSHGAYICIKKIKELSSMKSVVPEKKALCVA